MDFLQFFDDFVVGYTKVFTVTDNGTLRISGNGMIEINNFVLKFKQLYAVNGYPNPKLITVRPLGRGQAENMNLCKRDGFDIFQLSTSVYHYCTEGLFKSKREIQQPLLRVDILQTHKIKVEILVDEN